LKFRDILERFILTALTFLSFALFRDRFGLVQAKDYLVLIGILVSLYFVIVPLLLWLFYVVRNQYNRLVPKIGILNGYIADASREHKCVPKHTKIAGIVWERELREALKGMRLKRIKRLYAGEIDTSFALIINPYGENYPESDTDMRSTFQTIRSYMKNGGIFFASGAPFWFHQNTVTDKDGQWSVIRTIDNLQLMTEGLCFTSLGISVTMPKNEPLAVEVYQRGVDQQLAGDLLDGATKLIRWRAILPKTPDCVSLLREKEDRSYPLCAVQYDKGFLLHSGLWVEDEDSTEFQVLIQLLKTLITGRFSQFKL